MREMHEPIYKSEAKIDLMVIKRYQLYNALSAGGIGLTALFIILSCSEYPNFKVSKVVVSALGNPDRTTQPGVIYFGIAFIALVAALVFFYLSTILTLPSKSPPRSFGFSKRVRAWGGLHQVLKVSTYILAFSWFLVVQFPETWDISHFLIIPFPNAVIHSVGAVVGLIGQQWCLMVHGGVVYARGCRVRGRLLYLVPNMWLIYMLTVQATVWPLLQICQDKGNCDPDRDFYLVQWAWIEWIYFIILLAGILLAITTLTPVSTGDQHPADVCDSGDTAVLTALRSGKDSTFEVGGELLPVMPEVEA
eukprot:gnl/Dysnectes_brevis/3004_a3708_903.p1 GENE.gnl/Dysnectes_brevis/3004_a3708_903~~gnl/Dysnectes_brevis/3004_a3708_903.p1  ORF type:complete len:306 (+),score=47.79 gnl/Dysnectes_brevis/3004_a3708_903:1180-2097(+)